MPRPSTGSGSATAASSRSPSRGSSARRGIQLHAARLPSDEIDTVRGIRVTRVSRTILDLAAVRPRDEVATAIHEAEVRRLHDDISLPVLIERHPRHRGGAAIRSVVLLDRANLPRPRLNQHIGAHECDCVWADRRLMVELDGYAVHGTRRNFESDRERDRVLQARGWRVIRVTWRQLRNHPDAVVRDLTMFLT